MRKLRGFYLLIMTILLLSIAVPVGAAQQPEPETAGNTEPEKPVSQWKTENGNRYYYGADGELAKGFATIQGKTYYFGKKGVMQTGWKKIEKKKYYFGKKGVMQTGLKKIEGSYYYFNNKGVMQAGGFRKVNGSTYYLRKNGTAQTGWKEIEKKTYYFGKKGVMQTGLKRIGGKTYYFGKTGASKGVMQTGWKTVDGKKYYFLASGTSKGAAQTGWLKSGIYYYYFNSTGDMDPKKTVDNKRQGDSTGTAKEKTERRAEAIVAQITTPKMSKQEKLRVCFDFVMKYTGRRPRTPHYTGNDWPVVYANDMFLDGSGNCFSYAAAFAFLTKACGYEQVYACNDTGHGWTEINGLIYDPEEYRNTAHKYFGTSYSKVPGYKRAISGYNSPGRAFMHVKI